MSDPGMIERKHVILRKGEYPVQDLKKPQIEFFIEKSLSLGAVETKIISPQSVVTAAWVRLKCQFGCARYGASHCCPPNTPDHLRMREVLDGYERVLLIHCRGDVSPTKIVLELEREAFLSGFYSALSFGAGPCKLCKECNPKKCIQTGKTRPSMEACGIDVYATARSNGLPIEVLKDRGCIPDRYGILLVD